MATETNDSMTLQVFQGSPITITKNAVEKQYKKILERDSTLKKYAYTILGTHTLPC